MNSEEKNINSENDIEVFSLDNMSPDNTNKNVFDDEDSMMDVNIPEINSTSNGFMYDDASTQSMVERSVENETPVNTFSYTEIPTVDSNSVPTVENTFSYAEDLSSSNIPVEPAQNAFVYMETPVDLEVPLEDNSIVEDSAQNQFSYTDVNDVSQTTVEETKMEPIHQQKSYDEQSTVDSKSNFKFMILFAIIMLVIIFVLPYIAGYK